MVCDASLLKWGIESGLNKADCLLRIHEIVAEVVLSWVGLCLLESADAVCCLFLCQMGD